MSGNHPNPAQAVADVVGQAQREQFGLGSWSVFDMLDMFIDGPKEARP
jgi:hypothetical protein